MVLALSNSANLDTTFGVLFLAVSLSSIIYGANCLHCFIYYNSQRAKADGLLVRCLVLAIMIMDTVHGATIMHFGYYYSINHFGDYTAIATTIPWSAPTAVLLLALSAFAFNSFMTVRLWLLSESKALALISALLTLATLLTNISFSIRGYSFQSLSGGMHAIEHHGVAGIGFYIITEVYISSALSYQLYKGRTGRRKTNDLITRLILFTVATGMLTTPFNVADLIAYLTARYNLYVVFFNFLVAKLYANAFFTTLNMRKHLGTIAGEAHDLESLARTHIMQFRNPSETSTTVPPESPLAITNAPLPDDEELSLSLPMERAWSLPDQHEVDIATMRPLSHP